MSRRGWLRVGTVFCFMVRVLLRAAAFACVASMYFKANLGAADLYGRGYSDAPQTTYDTTLYVTQLALLMQHVKWEKAYLVGVSMVSPSISVLRGCSHGREGRCIFGSRNVHFLIGWRIGRRIHGKLSGTCAR